MDGGFHFVLPTLQFLSFSFGHFATMNSFNTEQYLQKWIPLNEKMREENFLWGTLFQDDEWHQYMAFDLYQMPPHQWNKITQATQKIAHIFQKTYQIISQDETLFQRLGLPASALGLKNLKNHDNRYFSYFARMDLIVQEDTIKIIEMNCDTPTGYLETAICNRIICEEHHCESPNHLEENIQAAWEQIKQDYAIQSTDIIYFTSYNWHDEDRETVQFIRNHCLNQTTRYIHINNIVVSPEGIFTPEGDKITFLYRLYPLEFFEEADDNRSQQMGHLFMEQFAKQRVKIINPLSAFVMQSKAVMALIYSFLEEHSPLFTEEELHWIHQYFLPTYFDEPIFKNHKEAYVAKPYWGREGGGISIFDHQQQVIDEDRTEYYYQQKMVYQQYLEMPEATITTWDGNYTGKLLIGSFLINGNPSGLFLRVGERITGNLSMFLGIAKTAQS
jgi:glutathionylspermidine synthase